MRGPSVFFGPPDPAKITAVHPIRQLRANTIKINLSRLLEDLPSTRIVGTELVPYNPAGPRYQGALRHKDIDLDAVRRYAATPPKELWKHYDSPAGTHYASDVPHAQIVTPTGHIPPEYILMKALEKVRRGATKKAEHTHSHTKSHGDKTYDILALIKALENREVLESPVSELPKPRRDKKSGFSKKRLENTDLNHPLLVSQDLGEVMDGRHRLIKAIEEGRENVKYKNVTPEDLAGVEIKEAQDRLLTRVLMGLERLLPASTLLR
jgi:hypothetical protein